MNELLKDRFFTAESLDDLCVAITKYFHSFDKEQFLRLVNDDNWKNLELKEKMRHTTHCLFQVLPDSYEESVDILMKAAPGVKGFEAMVLPDFVEVYGQEDWEISLPALGHFTQFSSSEFAIRPFLIKDLDQAMELMYSCAESEFENVRRFASEGCRPRLPWAMAVPELKADPAPVIPILEKLKNDPSEFVRRSVANNLNDISKDHPEIVLDLVEIWFGHTENTDKIIKHALRTLLKKGNTRAMRLFGFGDPGNLDIKKLRSDKKKLKIGDTLLFSFDLVVNEKSATKVRLEYAVFYTKSGGKQSKKVFQIHEKEYSPGSHSISRNQSFKNMSTRKHYHGEHLIAIIINGVEKARMAVQLSK